MSLQRAGYLIRCTRPRDDSRTCYVILSLRAVALLSKFNSFFIGAPTPLVSDAIKKKRRKRTIKKISEKLDRKGRERIFVVERA